VSAKYGMKVPGVRGQESVTMMKSFAPPQLYWAVRIDAYPTVLSFSVLRFQL
jgi:hypothetical protein